MTTQEKAAVIDNWAKTGHEIPLGLADEVNAKIPKKTAAYSDWEANALFEALLNLPGPKWKVVNTEKDGVIKMMLQKG